MTISAAALSVWDAVVEGVVLAGTAVGMGLAEAAAFVRRVKQTR